MEDALRRIEAKLIEQDKAVRDLNSKVEAQSIKQDKAMRNLNSKVDSALQSSAALAVKMESIVDRLPDGIRSTKAPAVVEETELVTETAPPRKVRDRQQRRRSLIEIPVELQTDILVRLPVKSILLCKCVCKHFRNIIQSPNFVQTHLTRINTTSDHTQSLILAFGDGGSDPWVQWDHFLVSFDNITKDVISSLGLTPPIPAVGRYEPGDQCHFVGSCNGLICVVVGQKKWTDFIFLLWNPVIKQCRYLPKSQRIRFPRAVEFGYVTKTNDYQIVKVDYESGFHVEVYKMSIDSWIVIDCSTLAGADIYLQIYKEGYIEIYQEETPLFLNGSFHWSFMLRSYKFVLYYNLKDEMLGVMKAVDDDEELNIYSDNLWKLAVIDESLAFIHWNDYPCNKLKVWVMNEYGVEDSWAIRYQIVDGISSALYPVNYWTNGNLFITNDVQGLHLYDLNTRRRRKKIPEMETNGSITAFCSFVETLVPVKPLG